MKATWYQVQKKEARWGEKIAPFALFSFRLIANGFELKAGFLADRRPYELAVIVLDNHSAFLL